MYEETFGLREIIDLFVRRWLWIAAAVLIAAGTAFLVTMLGPDLYEAEATAVVLQSRTEVRFDDRIETLADYELSRSSLDTRREALIALVTSNQVVQRVLDDVAEHLQPEVRNREGLRDMVETETTGDLININVRHSNPETAALIANSWIQHFERNVNDIYGSSVDVANSNTAQQIDDAREQYQAAQAELEAFVAEDPVPALQGEIEAQQALLDSYRQTLVDIQVNPVLSEQALLQSYYTELQAIETALADATALREQVAADSDSPAGNLGNALALILLRSRIFNGENRVAIAASQDGAATQSNPGVTAGAPTILQIDLSALPPEAVRTGDVDGLIQVLELRREAAQGRIDALVQSMKTGEAVPAQAVAESTITNRIAELEDEISDLQSEVEAFHAQRRELTETRDRNWETLQLLRGKQVEEAIASASPAAEVRIADTAVPPALPISRGLITNTLLAGVVGGLVAVGLILFWAWWSVEDAVVQGPEGAGSRPAPPREEEPGDGGLQPERLPS